MIQKLRFLYTISAAAYYIRVIQKFQLFVHDGCEGFVFADDLGSQIKSLLRAAAGGYSKQRHYDFGLRSLKARVKAAGSRARTVQYANEVAVVAEVCYETLHATCIATDKPVVRELVKQHFQLPLEASAVGCGEML